MEQIYNPEETKKMYLPVLEIVVPVSVAETYKHLNPKPVVDEQIESDLEKFFSKVE